MYFGRIAGTITAFLVPVLASTASAQAVEEKPFNGVYVGGAVGYDVQPNDVGAKLLFDRNLDGRFGDTVQTASGADAFAPGFCNGEALGHSPKFGCKNDRDGVGYYIRAGADHQYGHFVVGVVGEFGKSKITDSTSGWSSDPAAAYVLTRYIDWEASVRGRAGYAADRTLFYGTLGVGYTQINEGFGTTNRVNDFHGSGKNKVWGATFGGGIEQKVSRHISFGMEYLGHQYDDGDYRVRAVAGCPPVTNTFTLPPNTAGTRFKRSDDQFNWHSIRATVAYRF